MPISAFARPLFAPLPLDRREWPEEAVAFYRERAAIREINARMPRAHAEDAAAEDTRRWWMTR